MRPSIRRVEGAGIGQSGDPGAVLGAGEKVGTRLGRVGQVTFACRIDVRERPIPAPVLGRRVCGDHLRRDVEGTQPRQESGQRRLGQRVDVVVVCERRAVAEAVCVLDGRLRESVVELPAPSAGDVDVQPVERPLTGLVDVEAVRQQRAEEPP